MHLGYSIIYVASVPETLAFYDKAFGFKRVSSMKVNFMESLRPVPQPWLLQPMKWQR